MLLIYVSIILLSIIDNLLFFDGVWCSDYYWMKMVDLSYIQNSIIAVLLGMNIFLIILKDFKSKSIIRRMIRYLTKSLYFIYYDEFVFVIEQIANKRLSIINNGIYSS